MTTMTCRLTNLLCPQNQNEDRHEDERQAESSPLRNCVS